MSGYLLVRIWTCPNLKKKKNIKQKNKPSSNRKPQNCSNLDTVWWIRGWGGEKDLVSLQNYVSGDAPEIVGNALKITDWPHISLVIQTSHVCSRNFTKNKVQEQLAAESRTLLQAKKKNNHLCFYHSHSGPTLTSPNSAAAGLACCVHPAAFNKTIFLNLQVSEQEKLQT